MNRAVIQRETGKWGKRLGCLNSQAVIIYQTLVPDTAQYIHFFHFGNILNDLQFLDSYANWKTLLFFVPQFLCSCAERDSQQQRDVKIKLCKNSSTALLQVEVDRSWASTPLKDLFSQTRYTVSVSAVYDEGESPPATAQETTRELVYALWIIGRQHCMHVLLNYLDYFISLKKIFFLLVYS